MKKHIFALLMLLIPSLAWGATYYASPTGSGTTCSSESPCALEYTLETKATGGDTVNLAAGTYTEDSTISITAGIKVVGAGIGSTIIACPYNIACIWVAPANDTNNFELTGVTMQAATRGSSQILLGVNGATANPFTKLKVHNNKFEGAYNAIWLNGLESGVVYQNTFQDNYVTIRSTGAGASGWARNSDQGSSNFVFIEANTFTDTGTKQTDAFTFEGGQGGRIVFRYNTVNRHDGTGSGGEVFDCHGDQGERGTVAAEIYNNSIVNLNTDRRVMNHRGGKLMFFNNAVTGYAGNFSLTEYQGWSYCDADSYPKQDQINSSYYYSNTSMGGALNPYKLCPNDTSCECEEGMGTCNKPTTNYCVPAQNDSTYIQQNRDYWLTTKDGYSPYTCPHPLAGGGSCSATAGTGGYTLSNANLTIGSGAAVSVGSGAGIVLQ